MGAALPRPGRGADGYLGARVAHLRHLRGAKERLDVHRDPWFRHFRHAIHGLFHSSRTSLICPASAPWRAEKARRGYPQRGDLSTVDGRHRMALPTDTLLPGGAGTQRAYDWASLHSHDPRLRRRRSCGRSARYEDWGEDDGDFRPRAGGGGVALDDADVRQRWPGPRALRHGDRGGRVYALQRPSDDHR